MRLNPKESGELIVREAQYVQVQELGINNLAKQVMFIIKLLVSISSLTLLILRLLKQFRMGRLTSTTFLNMSSTQSRLTQMPSIGFFCWIL